MSHTKFKAMGAKLIHFWEIKAKPACNYCRITLESELLQYFVKACKADRLNYIQAPDNNLFIQYSSPEQLILLGVTARSIQAIEQKGGAL